MNHQSDKREQLNDAQVATITVIAMLYFGLFTESKRQLEK
jgi:hypothetical protein